MSAQIRSIQQQLNSLGFDPGPADGVWGRRTQSALRAFQALNGLEADGVAGPKTLAALFPSNQNSQPETLVPWYEEASHLLGLREGAGSGNNQKIMDWAEMLELKYANDDVPWCGLFVAHCISSTLPNEPLPGNPLGARQWERLGSATQPRMGAVMVFWRNSPHSGLGHVGFYAGEDAEAYRILGGNQSDSVSYTWIPKSRLVGARWPATAAFLQTQPQTMTRDGALSAKEF